MLRTVVPRLDLFLFQRVTSQEVLEVPETVALHELALFATAAGVDVVCACAHFLLGYIIGYFMGLAWCWDYLFLNFRFSFRWIF